jgi:hypothetical protein
MLPRSVIGVVQVKTYFSISFFPFNEQTLIKVYALIIHYHYKLV